MTSGGARARSGPPPDPHALRRDRDRSEWRHLARRHDLPTPAWPLSKQTARERELWDEEWRRPQAAMWADLGMSREVALYVRTLKDAEMPKAATSTRALVARFQDALGLSVVGLRANRWIIDSDEAAAPPSSTGAPPPVSIKDRLTLVVQDAG